MWLWPHQGGGHGAAPRPQTVVCGAAAGHALSQDQAPSARRGIGSRLLPSPSAVVRLSPASPAWLSLAVLCCPPPLSHLMMVIKAEAGSRRGLLCVTHDADSCVLPTTRTPVCYPRLTTPPVEASDRGADPSELNKKGTEYTIKGKCLWHINQVQREEENGIPDFVCVCVSRSVLSNSLRPHGLKPARLLCPWSSPGKNTGVGCLIPSPGDFPDPGITLRSPAL